MLLDLRSSAYPALAPPLAHDTAIWLGGYDLTGALSSVALAGARAEVEDLQSGDEVAASFPGTEQVDAIVRGAYAAGPGQPDTVVAPRLFGGSYDEWPLTILPPNAPGAAGDDGNVAYNVRSVQHGIEFSGEHGQLLPFYLASRARTGKLDRGLVMIPKATRTGSFDGTQQPLGPIPPGVKLVCVLHVFSVTGGGGSVTVTVENVNAHLTATVVMGTFAAVATPAGVGRQVLEVTAAAPHNYWRFRAAFTPGTNYALAAVAAMEAAA